MNKEKLFNSVSESLERFYEVNDTLPEHLTDQIEALNDGISKIEKIYDELSGGIIN